MTATEQSADPRERIARWLRNRYGMLRSYSVPELMMGLDIALIEAGVRLAPIGVENALRAELQRLLMHWTRETERIDGAMLMDRKAVTGVNAARSAAFSEVVVLIRAALTTAGWV